MEQDLHKPTLRVLNTLRVLADCSCGMTLSELAAKMGASKATLFAVVKTMEEVGFLTFDPASNRYRVGPEAYLTGQAYAQDKTASMLVRTEIERLVAECGETCQLGVLDGSDVLYLIKVDSPAPIRLVSSVGSRVPAYRTALGKALMSDMDESKIREIIQEPLERMTEKTIVSVDELIDVIARQGREGVYSEYEESGPDLACLSMPLRRDGRVFAAISVAVPTFRLTAEKRSEIVSILRKYGLRIEAVLESNRDSDDLFGLAETR